MEDYETFADGEMFCHGSFSKITINYIFMKCILCLTFKC